MRLQSLIGLSLITVMPLLGADLGSAPVAATNAAAMLAQNGGMVAVWTGPDIVVLNQQKAVSVETIQATVNHIKAIVRVPIVIKSAGGNAKSGASLIQGELAAGTNKVIAVVLVTSAADQPSLLVAPDDHWAIVNVDALAAGAPKDERANVQAERLRKELWRAAAMAVGATGSMQPKDVLGATAGVAGLDDLGHGPSLDAVVRFMANAKHLGAHMQKIGNYRRAVAEGWAPAPTNDIQRAIWNEARKK